MKYLGLKHVNFWRAISPVRFVRRLQRKRFRKRLNHTYWQAHRIAFWPAFLDKDPRHDLHRAIRSAFYRGLKKGLQDKRERLITERESAVLA